MGSIPTIEEGTQVPDLCFAGTTAIGMHGRHFPIISTTRTKPSKGLSRNLTLRPNRSITASLISCPRTACSSRPSDSFLAAYLSNRAMVVGGHLVEASVDGVSPV
ncbi:hypothetical protein MRB53_003252 [Persea americana]|uniref:Uncharacterized protein n=1 Tax=Persea americana TaxID=3435 RepID=A0ACC2MX35_PERAE|nr:hypothetical protein MRB53_003252 [Persea americana]|eukprot:TRINITY_DN37740_c0_g1_i1.p1 TRINITY_DN37740_c0_g1~~TRINITY_DN37740_c0_g1_i1.p1  ORF type:complete len:105 (+),score=16.80 TRINITY_DN37740_c0_g1_i1:14-328(+)